MQTRTARQRGSKVQARQRGLQCAQVSREEEGLRPYLRVHGLEALARIRLLNRTCISTNITTTTTRSEPDPTAGSPGVDPLRASQRPRQARQAPTWIEPARDGPRHEQPPRLASVNAWRCLALHVLARRAGLVRLERALLFQPPCLAQDGPGGLDAGREAERLDGFAIERAQQPGRARQRTLEQRLQRLSVCFAVLLGAGEAERVVGQRHVEQRRASRERHERRGGPRTRCSRGRARQAWAASRARATRQRATRPRATRCGYPQGAALSRTGSPRRPASARPRSGSWMPRAS